MTQELSPEARKAAEIIAKLLNQAAKAGTAEEAATFTAKAQALLLRHNLSAEMVEREGNADARREQAAVEGGFYAFNRKLWAAVADLNFCIHWVQKYKATGYRRWRDENGKTIRRELVDDKLKSRHAVVGRLVNVRSTIAMAQYLEQAVERITSEKLHDNEGHRMSRWAFSFRDGVVMTVVEKLEEQRAAVLDEEERLARASARAAAAGASSATALTVAAFSENEEAANLDFIHGEGYSRRRAEARAARAKRFAEEEAAYTAWAEANPEDARKQAEQDRKREEKNATRRRGRWNVAEDKTDWGAFRAGRDAGSGISLHQQADTRNAPRIGR